MSSELPLLMTLTGGLAAALFLGYLTHKLGLSPIVGYLLAGILLGPYTPGFIADRQVAEQMANIGIILLMFGVGLNFHIKELLAVRKVALPGAAVVIVTAVGLGLLAGRAMGWDPVAGVVFGLCLSVSSTVVMARVLADNRVLHTPAGRIAIGWTVLEDILTVIALVVLSALFAGGVATTALAGSLGLTALKIAALLVFIFFIGARAIPWVLTRAANTGSRELFTLTVLVLALGIAVGSAELFGVSMALGAFLAGMVIGRSDFSLRAATEALPMRDAFAVLFFVAVGMLFDWRQVLVAPVLMLATAAIVVVAKPLAALAVTLLLGQPLRNAIAVSVALGQIGEFSFILAALAVPLGVIPPLAADAVIAASIVSISINPLLCKLTRPAATWLGRQAILPRLLTRIAEPTGLNASSSELKDYDAIVVGYGPIGRTVTRLLQDNGIRPAVIEMNLSTVRELQQQGLRAFYGDASQPETLRLAGIEHAEALILTPSQLHGTEEIIRHAKALNPRLRVLTRATYLREQAGLVRSGADMVLSDEGEVAIAMIEAVLRSMGATPEQIDRERERLHHELPDRRPHEA